VPHTRGATRSRGFSPPISAGCPPPCQQDCGTAKLSPNANRATYAAPTPRRLQGSVHQDHGTPSNCISPIGEEAILHGLYKQIKGDFYTAVTGRRRYIAVIFFRSIIEAGLAFARGQSRRRRRRRPAVPLAEGEQQDDDNELARVIRYANRVPAPSAVGLRDLQVSPRTT